MQIEIDRHILSDIVKYDKEEKKALHRAEIALILAFEAHAKRDSLIQFLVEKVNLKGGSHGEIIEETNP